MVPTIDEFGGYASRIRIPEMVGNPQPDKTNKSKAKSSSKKLLHSPKARSPKDKDQSRKVQNVKCAVEMDEEEEDGLKGENINLCKLLGIDVERLALEIVNDDL